VRSVGRITALILVIAAVTILVLAVLVVSDVTLETELNREVIGAQQAKDGLESLRSRMHELKYAARDAELTGRAESLREVERRVIEADADLFYLQERASADATLAANVGALLQDAKAFIVHTRASTARARAPGARTGFAPDSESEAIEARAWAALERSLEAQTRRINERTTAQIRVGENLHVYVLWLLAGSITVLGGLFAVFQHAQARNRESQRRIERLAHYDLVTNLPNRSLLSDRLAQETTRSTRANEAFAVAMFDLDGFKSVNDTLGHAAGDRLLAIVAQRARECMRASDTLGRLGGDEFLALLPHTGREGALQAAEKIRAALSMPYEVSSKRVSISASVGVSLFPEHGSDPDALLRAADAALYTAKREGKDRVCAARAAA
jgi:diguanylate cyclase (GGDEF)-like protein